MYRWEEDGVLTKLPDPDDPSGRGVRYAGPEVEAVGRRLRRLEEGEADGESEQGRVPRDRESSRPKVPRRRRAPRAPSVTPAKMSIAPKPTSSREPARGVLKRTEPATAPPRSTPKAVDAPVAPPAPPMLTDHAPAPGDQEAEAWEREIDGRKAQLEREEAAGTQGETPPSSSSPVARARAEQVGHQRPPDEDAKRDPPAEDEDAGPKSRRRA